MSIHRLYVRKKSAYAQEEIRLLQVFREELKLPITGVAIYERYDIEGIQPEHVDQAKNLIFSEPPVDSVYDELPVNETQTVLGREYLPGQYDQRADSAEQCIAMLTLRAESTVRSAQFLVLDGLLSDEERKTLVTYYINPVDSREATLNLPDSLQLITTEPKDVQVLENFTSLTKEDYSAFISEYGLAMSQADLDMIRCYFAEEEHRNPTITELRVLDTYWSDHCRHTTFMTELSSITIKEGLFTSPIQEAFDQYMSGRSLLYKEKEKARTLMDMATLAVKELRAQGKLQEIDESDEINACTIVVPVEVDGKTEEWLLLFKNETHNHPTEIEPFGGAATCLGGCIRDPLSGRAYVYQAMRVTGSGDPRQALEDTMPGKLPQRLITTGAAKGYSSYGNQIGLATGEVKEYYHPGYIAKRMEIGAVIGAAPRFAVKREVPAPGDVVVLLGGKTGRDGCGGATGSSKEHTMESLENCGAEVQKGNALTERKIQRLFRRPEVTPFIKRCNDFGAGGVSVAIGELTDGVHINLDLVPKKYEGLDGTELAISESQERMACVLAPTSIDAFFAACREENLEATVVATVTADSRLIVTWRGKEIVNISREFLSTNGAHQEKIACVDTPQGDYFVSRQSLDIKSKWIETMSSLPVASQQGLAERFDSTIGAGSVLMPFGGKYQKTPVQGMVAKLPVLHGDTTTVSIMTHGFDPYLSSWSPFHGAQYAILWSVAKVLALGGNPDKTYLTLQEYFEKLGDNANSWGKPVAALLGAYSAQKALGIGAIGGKDSMSGTFMDYHVPPSLISFAVTTTHVDRIVSPEFKKSGNAIVLFHLPIKADGTPQWDVFKEHNEVIQDGLNHNQIVSMYALGAGGIAEGVTKMALGNQIGATLDKRVSSSLFDVGYGSILAEVDEDIAEIITQYDFVTTIGKTTGEKTISIGSTNISLAELENAYESPLSSIFPMHGPSLTGEAVAYIHDQKAKKRTAPSIAKPKVLIPVFPGTNCEYDSAAAFNKAGAVSDIFVIRNQTIEALEESIQILRNKLKESQIIMFPGGFSAGDEPDGSGKFMATLFRNPYLTEALHELLYDRDGLALGICNGFQALIKLGLLPSGRVSDLTENSPTLTYNTIGRHISNMVHTKVISTKSPWMSLTKAGEIYVTPVSHGEGRFISSPAQVVEFNRTGQIATQYVDLDGIASMDSRYNPNGSTAAIEGLFSPDGRVFGKMAHIERTGYGIAKNIPGDKFMPVFAGGVNYFK